MAKVITLAGIGRMKSPGSVVAGLAIVGAAAWGGWYLWKKYKASGTPGGTGRMLIGDHNSRVMANWYARQHELGMQRQTVVE